LVVGENEREKGSILFYVRYIKDVIDATKVFGGESGGSILGIYNWKQFWIS
jgi:hypothetical protein